MQSYFRILILPILYLLTGNPLLQAQTPRDYVVDLQATVSDTVPRITLSWSQRLQGNITGQTLYRRSKGASSWGTALATLTTSQTSYADSTAAAGVEYEYWMKRALSSNPSTAMGYLSSGVKVPAVDSRGTLLLVVDDTMITPLATEIAVLTRDIASDGWTVQQITAPRSGTAASTKALIKAAYTADPTNVKAVYLLGHVPVPYSGWFGPDGHGSRALPADIYYADMTGTWTDTSNYSTSGSTGRNDNCAGDGKFDQSYPPGQIKLQVGRVDMANLDQAPTAGTPETTLLRRYLRKEHDFRFEQGAYANIPRRTLIRDGFGYFSGENFAMNGWATGFTCVSPSSTTPFPIDEAPQDQWFTYATNNSYLTGHINGSGGPTSFQNGGVSFEFGRKPSKVVFTSGFGSFSEDWDCTDAAMRTMLAGNATGDSLALTCYWTGRPNYFTYHLGMGETFGYAVKNTQINGSSLTPAGIYAGYAHVSLLGDPSLRLHVVQPPRDLTATSANGQVMLAWTASTETALQGYNVYRATTPAGPFTKLTTTPLSTTTYTDSTGTAGQTYVYLVRTLKLETSPGGSYYNLSHGDMLTVTVNSGATAAPLSPSSLNVCLAANGKLNVTWKDNAPDETRYVIERKSKSNGTYLLRGYANAGSTSFTDCSCPAAGMTYYYRVTATSSNGTIKSIPAADAYLETPAGTFDFQAVAMMTVPRTAGTARIPVERFGGVAEAASVTWTTSDSSAVSGTHYTGGTGTLNWAAGEGGVKYICIPLTQSVTPQQPRQFRVNLTSSCGADIGQYGTMAVLIEDTAATLPSPWNQIAINDGSAQTLYYASPAVQAEGELGSAVCGGYGLDSSMTWESGHFLYQSHTGDGTLTAYVPTPAPAQTAGRFAVIVRETTDWTSAMAATVLTGDPTVGAKFIYRSTTSTNSVLTPTATNSLVTPCWLRLTRAGNTFTSLTSADGITWTQLGSATVPLASTANWGFFHISNGVDYHRNPFSDYQLAEFQNVSFQSSAQTNLSVGNALSGGVGYDAWMAGYPAITGSNILPGANPANDGMSNLLKYALGLNPTVPGKSPGTTRGNTLTFNKGSMAQGDSNIVYSIEESTDLVTWTTQTGASVTNGPTAISYTYPGGQTKVFARLKVIQTP